MLEPSQIEACVQEDFETVPPCEGPNPEPPDDDDGDPEDPGGFSTPPNPGPGPFGEEPCDPGPAPMVFAPLGPTIRLATPPPGVTRVVRLYPQHLSGGAPGTAGAGTGALSGHDTIRTFPCPEFGLPGAPPCDGEYTVSYHYDGPDLWITWTYPQESSEVAYRVEDYNGQGQLINAWQVDCEWLLPNWPLLHVFEVVDLYQSRDYPTEGPSTLSVQYGVTWTKASPIIPIGATNVQIEVQMSTNDTDFTSPDTSAGFPVPDEATWITGGTGLVFGGNCLPQRVAAGSFQADIGFFRARFTWNNPGFQAGPWSPVVQGPQLHAIEVEPLWAINPNYCV